MHQRGSAGLHCRRPDAAHLQNLTRDIISGQESGGGLRSAAKQSDTEQGRGAGHARLGGFLQRALPNSFDAVRLSGVRPYSPTAG